MIQAEYTDDSSTVPVPILWEYPAMRCQCPTEGYCQACRQNDALKPGSTALAQRRARKRGRPRRQR